jgi:hypothetical protein
VECGGNGYKGIIIGASRDKVYLMWNVGEMDTRESLDRGDFMWGKLVQGNFKWGKAGHAETGQFNVGQCETESIQSGTKLDKWRQGSSMLCG